jgi:hypothetical protein
VTAPTFISATDIGGNYATTSSPLTSGNIAVTNGDHIVVVSGAALGSATPVTTSTATGSTSAWTKPQDVGANSGEAEAAVAWATATATGNVTVTTSRAGGTIPWGATVYVIRDASGVGASAAHATSGGSTPSLSITTTQANSLLIWGSFDWNAVTPGTPTYRANFGANTETRAAVFVSGQYTVYNCYHADTGATGTAAVGMTLPSGQLPAMVALEIKGQTGTNITASPGVVAGTGGVPAPNLIVPAYVTTTVTVALNMP